MITLNPSRVVFDQSAHTYTAPDGTLYSGVTSLLGRTIFKDKYIGIDEAALERARQRGTAVHEVIELYESIGADGTMEYAYELDAYKSIRRAMTEENPLCANVATEYLMDDAEYAIASSADLVDTDGETFTLLDIKTTAKLDIPYCAWQLSIYKWMFERQNPGASVGSIGVVWLPKERYGKPRMVKLNIVPAAEVEALLQADAAGEMYMPPADFAPDYNFDLDARLRIIDYLELRRQINTLKAQADQQAEEITALMAQAYAHGTPSFSMEDCTLTFSPATTSNRFDSTAFRKANAELYAQFTKTTEVKPTIKVTFK